MQEILPGVGRGPEGVLLSDDDEDGVLELTFNGDLLDEEELTISILTTPGEDLDLWYPTPPVALGELLEEGTTSI